MGRRYLTILLLIAVATIAGAVICVRMVVAQSQIVKAVETPTVQKWEYRVVDVEGKNLREKAEAVANALGDQGFEMVNFKTITEGHYTYQFVFKRPKPQ